MTPSDLAAIEARANAATPGPWTVDEMEMYIHAADGHMVASNCPTEDAWQIRGAGAVSSGQRPSGSQDANTAFIAAARSDVPALLAEVKRLTALLPPYARTQSFAIWVEEHQRLEALLNDVVELVRNPTTTMDDVRSYVGRLQKLRDG